MRRDSRIVYKPLDDIPDALLLELGRDVLAPEVIRLRRLVQSMRDWRKSSKNKNSAIARLRKALIGKHAQLKNQGLLLRNLGHPGSGRKRKSRE